MKFLLTALLISLLCSCSPRKDYQLTTEHLEGLEKQQAVQDWRRGLKETDECSSPPVIGWVADTIIKKNWQDCCWQHDFDYRFGSAYGITKAQADYSLWQCVDAAGHPIIANIVYDAVSLFGVRFYRDE